MIWKSFSEGYHKKRIYLEIIIPILISLLSISISVLSDLTVTEVINKIKNVNGQLFTIIAIQVGFNITSLSLIAAFNKETLRNAFSKLEEMKKEKALRQLLASFVYCVFIQSAIIIIGLVYYMNVDDLFKIELLVNLNEPIQLIIAFTFYFLWLIVIFHSFMVFLRNVTLIYKFILVTFKRSN